jgi:hypothetical protein
MVVTHMALSEVHRPGLQLRRVESVGSEECVRHVDELSEAALSEFLDLVERDAPARVDGDPALTENDIIAFTDFYRFERV